MTSSNGNIFRVTGPLCGEFTGHWKISLTTASDTDLWCFLWSAPWINGWVNNRGAGEMRRHRAHYDVILMLNAESERLVDHLTHCCRKNSKWVYNCHIGFIGIKTTKANISELEFCNMASDWLVGVLPANQKPCMNKANLRDLKAATGL